MQPITTGYDFNYFGKVVVSLSSYSATSNLDINIKYMKGFIICNDTPSSVLRVSFNGNTDHMEILGGEKFQFDRRVIPGIWARAVSGGAITVRLMAWG